MLEPESILRHGEQVLARQGSGTIVLLKLADGQYFALDGVGGRVWELCDGARSISEVVSIVSIEYDASATTIAADVFEILADLVNEELLVDDS